MQVLTFSSRIKEQKKNSLTVFSYPILSSLTLVKGLCCQPWSFSPETREHHCQPRIFLSIFNCTFSVHGLEKIEFTPTISVHWLQKTIFECPLIVCRQPFEWAIAILLPKAVAGSCEQDWRLNDHWMRFPMDDMKVMSKYMHTYADWKLWEGFERKHLS